MVPLTWPVNVKMVYVLQTNLKACGHTGLNSNAYAKNEATGDLVPHVFLPTRQADCVYKTTPLLSGCLQSCSSDLWQSKDHLLYILMPLIYVVSLHAHLYYLLVQVYGAAEMNTKVGAVQTGQKWVWQGVHLLVCICICMQIMSVYMHRKRWAVYPSS